MEENRQSDKWYDTSCPQEENDETSPHSARRTEVQTPEGKKRRTWIRVVAGILCLVVLIAATAAAFPLNRRGDSPSPELMEPQSTAKLPLPEPGAPETLPPQTSQSPHAAEDFDDFREFFEQYFTAGDTAEESRIPRYEGPAQGSLSLESASSLSRLTLQEIYRESIDSVVGIRATTDGKMGYFWGTGIVLSRDGYILTNAHVIAGTDAASVILNDGSTYTAQLVGEDSQSDLAVLHIEAEDLHPARFGVSDELQVGDEVVAIGNPLGTEFSGTMTNGIVSAINRGVISDGHVMTLIQTNAALNEGNSGGPLFNMYGQVVGVTNMKMAADYSSVTIEGIGFAIPTSSAKTIVDQLMQSGKVSGRPGLGITVGAVPEEASARWQLPGGLYITKVEENSDAGAKDIRPGDILIAVNGTPVYTTQDVLTIKDQYAVGESLTLSIFREGETFDVEVTLVDMNDLY